MTRLPLAQLACALSAAYFPLLALAQGGQQLVKPPQAQAWIDLATFSGMGMGAGAKPMAGLAGLEGMFGGGAKKDEANRFGQTQSMAAGRWMDVTLYSRAHPGLAEAQQSVPPGFMAGPALRLQSPPELRAAPPEPSDERVIEPEQEQRHKGKMLLYWGCGDMVRPGQPRVIDFASATPTELAKYFVQSRRATQRGSHAATGRPHWPSRDDRRMIPAAASLVGEHAYSAAGLPEGLFRFQIPAAQDLMPAIALTQQERHGATHLEWQALPTARAYFISAMGARANSQEMVIWTSSEQPDMGFGLQDYQTNAAVDRWLKEQVLLAPQTTRCSVPKDVFGSGQGAMLRMIAYGSELKLAHPPRPSDVKIPWEPQWAVTLRLKSVASAMLGMDMGDMMMMDQQQQQRERPAKGDAADEPAKEPPPKKPGVSDVLKGLFGR